MFEVLSLGRNRLAFALFAFGVAGLGVASSCGCGGGGGGSLERGLDLYRQNRLDEALPYLERAVEEREDDATTHAWLAETYRRLKEPEKAAELARKAIDLEPCSSFGHTVLAWNYNPMYGMWPGVNKDMAWRHLMKAAECDSMDGNIWTGVWTEAIRRGDRASERRALRLLLETGFLTPSLLSYNRWMLEYLPEGSLLLTNGDWDTYPAVALQQEEGLRTDVAVVNRSLLNVAWYASHLAEHYGLSLPFTAREMEALKPEVDSSGKVVTISTKIFRGWLERSASGEFTMPIAVSVTVNEDDLGPGLEDHLALAGPFWLWKPEPVLASVDTALIAESLAGLEPEDFAGPLVSAQDRSPVRMTGSNFLVHNVSAAGLRYAEALVDAERFSDAEEILNRIEDFESHTALGPASEEQIASIREKLEEAR